LVLRIPLGVAIGGMGARRAECEDKLDRADRL
jgi:hypothetical protein